MNGTLPVQKATLAEINKRSKGTLAGTIGIEFSALTPEYLEATMPVDSRTVQPYGLLHGGASLALVETLGSVGSTLFLEQGQKCVGIEINASHLRSATEGRVTGRARPLKIGRRLHFWDVEIRNDAGEMTCVGRLTVAVI